MYREKFYTVQGTGFNVYRTVCIAYGTGYNGQGSGYNVQRTVCKVKSTGYNVQRTVCNVQGTGYTMLKKMFREVIEDLRSSLQLSDAQNLALQVKPILTTTCTCSMY